MNEIRTFDMHSTSDEVATMTYEEAIMVLLHDAESNGKTWSARPHKQKAAQLAIEALKRCIEQDKHSISC